jgi:hypothetical protein
MQFSWCPFIIQLSYGQLFNYLPGQPWAFSTGFPGVECQQSNIYLGIAWLAIGATLPRCPKMKFLAMLR